MPTLNWLTKENDQKIVGEVPSLSAGEKSIGNMLIQDGNLEALLPFYVGQVNVSISTRRTAPAPPLNIIYDDNRERI